MPMNLNMRFISEAEVAERLTRAMAFDSVTAALIAHYRKNCDQPLKPYVRPGGRDSERERGRYIAMPAYVGEPVDAVGIKWIASVPANVDRMLPRASGVVILNDVTTGRPYAIIDCATLSARRTGAVAAIAFAHLGLRGQSLSLIGCGPINREVAFALTETNLSISQLRLFDLNQERAENLRCELLCNTDISICICTSLKSCVCGSTNIITATTGAKGYIDPNWLSDCRFALPLSLDDFCSETLLAADKIVVDDFDQSNREEKLFHHIVRQGLLHREQIYAELGEIVAGVKAGRAGDEMIYCNCMGMAVEDIAVAKAVFDSIEQD
jgi:N-[(2S)-2-amino-2-carboxyethyl]-L-glutamate dehydrogenase